MSQVVAILCSDLHLSDKVPSCRDEDYWYTAMARFFDELLRLSNQYKVCVLCAGDVFDTWNVSSELINWVLFALSEFKYEFCSVYGQHDLPHHNKEDLHRSGYYTLKLTKYIMHAGDLIMPYPKCLQVTGFSWGDIPKPCDKTFVDPYKCIKVGLIHRFVWLNQNSKHPMAKDDSQVRNVIKEYPGFDVLVFGDNHMGFIKTIDGVTVCNCGTPFRRKRNEIDYAPFVGLLYSDGSVKKYHLDISKDLFRENDINEEKDEEKDLIQSSGFVAGLKEIEQDSLDYRDLVRKTLDAKDVKEKVRGYVLKSLEA